MKERFVIVTLFILFLTTMLIGCSEIKERPESELVQNTYAALDCTVDSINTVRKGLVGTECDQYSERLTEVIKAVKTVKTVLIELTENKDARKRIMIVTSIAAPEDLTALKTATAALEKSLHKCK